MKKDYIIFIAFLLAVVGSTSVKAQEDRTKSITQSYLRGWEYSLKAGFSICASRNKEHDDRSYRKKLWYEDYQYQWW